MAWFPDVSRRRVNWSRSPGSLSQIKPSLFTTPRMMLSLLQFRMTITDSWATTASGTGNFSRFVLTRTRAAQCASPITTYNQIADTNPSVTFTGQLSDVSQVEKFELSAEAYAQRSGNPMPPEASHSSLNLSPADTVLAHKQRQKLGRFAEKPDEESQETEEDVNIQVGSRCQVESTEPGFHKRGAVRFVGKTKFALGVWVGVEYDEPIGKNDGSSVLRFPFLNCKFADRYPRPESRERSISSVNKIMGCLFDQAKSKLEISRLRRSTLMRRCND